MVSNGYTRGAFISIHALREEGDTAFLAKNALKVEFLSTPSARRATLYVSRGRCMRSYFYPRPPRGGRLANPDRGASIILFLSTPSARRATKGTIWAGYNSRFLSTPSARRATYALYSPVITMENFYPRPPRGGRPSPVPVLGKGKFISIHALREEGDCIRILTLTQTG